MKHIAWLAMIMAVGCGGGDSSAQSSRGGRGGSAEAAVAGVVGRLGAAAGRAALNPSAPVVVVADEAVLRRIIAKDPSLTEADFRKLYASGRSTQYVKDFEALGSAREAAIQFRSADDKNFGVVWLRTSGKFPPGMTLSEKKKYRPTEFENHFYVGVWKDPTPEEAKEYAADGQLACYQRVATWTSRVESRPKNEDQEESMWSSLAGAWRTEAGEELRKKGGICEG